MTRDSSRPATIEDISAIVALVGDMYRDVGEEYGGARPDISQEWARATEDALAERLGHDVMAFVIERPAAGVVAVAVGRLQETLPSPRRRGTTAGYVDWVATHRDFRRQGFARAVTESLVTWFESRGAGVVELHASSAAEGLYRDMGFDGGGPVSLSRRLA